MSFVGMPDPMYMNTLEVEPFSEVGGSRIGGIYRRKNYGKSIKKNKASFIKNLMKLGYSKKVAEYTWKLEEKDPKLIGTVKSHYMPNTKKKKAKKGKKGGIIIGGSSIAGNFDSDVYDSDDENEFEGGIYHRGHNTKEQDYASFKKGLQKMGWADRNINKAWKDEEKDPLRIGILKGNYAKGKHEKPIRRPSAYNVFIGKELKKGKSLKEAIELYRKHKEQKKKPLPPVPGFKPISEPGSSGPQKHMPYPTWRKQFMAELGKEYNALKPSDRKEYLAREWRGYVDERFHPGYTGTGF